MVKPAGLMLLGAYAALSLACGIECREGFAIAAAATAASVNANLATCGGAAGSDHPQCDDPSHDNAEGPPGAARARKHDPRTVKSSRGERVASAQCPSGDCEAIRPVVGRPRFQSGDIIELYNADSRDIQIVFPSIVKGRDPGSSGGYSVTKTTDGKEVKNIPERFLHHYEPYGKGDEALCNIGEFKPARPIIVRCTILDYAPVASRGAMVLQGNYSVQVHATKANDEYETQLPVWKLQRRYLATATTTATATS
ncbi:hypothetical protein ACHAWF_013991 [Thalassiosira exigua]